MSRASAEQDVLKNVNFKQPKKEDLPQQNTKNIQASNYFTGRNCYGKKKLWKLWDFLAILIQKVADIKCCKKSFQKSCGH